MKQGHFEKGAWIEHNSSEYCDICGFKYTDHPNHFQELVDRSIKSINWSEFASSNIGGGVMQLHNSTYIMDYTMPQPSTKYPIEETYNDLSTILLGLTIATIIILTLIYILFW